MPGTIEHYSDEPHDLMRALEAPSSPSPTRDEGSANSEDAGEDVDVDKIAREVYGILRNRLRIEQERRGGKS
jgi:hypothetical protein